MENLNSNDTGTGTGVQGDNTTIDTQLDGTGGEGATTDTGTNDTAENGQGSDGTGGEGGSEGGDPDGLLYDGKPIPDFVPPEETPREKELRLQLEELKQKQGDTQRQQDIPTAAPVKPKRDDFFNDDDYETALRQHFTDQDNWEQREQRQAQAIEQHQAQFKEAVGLYAEKRQVVATKLKDFDRIEKHADDNLNPEIVAAILFGTKSGTFSNAPEMLYAIGRNPDLMKQLNETTNPFLAGAMLLDISKKSGWAPAAPKKDINAIPEIGGAPSTSLDAELERAEAEADRTGDRTKVIELRAQISARNAKK